MIKLYTYKQCDTCRKAVRFLRERGIDFQELPIRETPPSPTELKVMLERYEGDLRKLFNTSGVDYKALGMKDKLPTLSSEEALLLLAKNGNLVKRPFLLSDKFQVVGFRESEWKKLLE